MVTYFPSYYTKFRCIADRCKNNCCRGWLVEIDRKTLAKYKKARNKASFIREHINEEGGAYSFVMNEEGNCPFLDSQGLCRIISEVGEGYLCDICARHPRFRNIFSSREEIGLGLSCEEAARIVLEEKEPFSLVCNFHGEENLTAFQKRLIAKREEAFEIMGGKDNIIVKLQNLAEKYAIDFSDNFGEEFLETLLSLEYMKEEFSDLLEKTRGKKISHSKIPQEYEMQLSNLASYIIFRHFSIAENDSEIRLAAAYLLLIMYYFIIGVAEKFRANEGFSIADIQKLARIYSAEIEYSQDNIEIILSELEFAFNI